MFDRLEETDHVRYLSIKVPGRRQPLTYHTYDWGLGEGDEVRICAGQLEDRTGTVHRVEVEPPTRHGSLTYSYRVERHAPYPVAILMSDGSRRPI